MNADGSDQHLLHEYVGLLFADAPVWSPDGRLIAFNIVEEGDLDVWVVPAEGGEAVNNSNLTGDDTMISWSPDSTALTFTNETEEAISQYVASVDGSLAYPLLEGQTTGRGMWSPVALPVVTSSTIQTSE